MCVISTLFLTNVGKRPKNNPTKNVLCFGIWRLWTQESDMPLYYAVYSPFNMWLSIYSKAAEQAKASPALVAKDPSTSTNKKEEEDLAKGKKTFFHPHVAIEN